MAHMTSILESQVGRSRQLFREECQYVRRYELTEYQDDATDQSAVH